MNVTEQRPRPTSTLAIVGASGFIGSALCQYTAHEYITIALTRSRHRAAEGSPGSPVHWQACDFFLRSAMREALAGVDQIVYLAHTRVPTARLDQARCSDMDVLQADNCALAAAHHGVQQIIYLSGLLPEGNVSEQMLRERSEIVNVLENYGTPVTVIRTSLVVGPGSSAVLFLTHLVRRLPLIPIPRWAQTERRPIALADLLRAIKFCLDEPAASGRSFDIGGPESLSTTEIVERIAKSSGRDRSARLVSWFPASLYGWLLRIISPSTHPGLINFFLQGIRYDMKIDDNPLQSKVAQGALTLTAALQDISLTSPRQSSLVRDRKDFEQSSSVRSIQRIPRPDDWNAESLSEYYFPWLARLVWPFVYSRRLDDGSWRIEIRGIKLPLLCLSLSESRRTDNRQLYFITGGMLASTSEESKGRMEFRDLAMEASTIIAIHDFTPKLPWRFYNLTQATIHGWVMRRFQKHMARYCRKP